MTTLAIAGTVCLSSFGAGPAKTPFNPEIPWNVSVMDQLNATAQNGPDKKAAKDPSEEYNNIPTFNYITSPDGTYWFYTSQFKYETIVHDEGFYTWEDYIMHSFKFTIYDMNFNVVGTIQDEIEYAPDETRVVQLSLEPMVTDYFFNDDANPEIMIYHAMNTTRYVNRNYYKVYSMGGEKNEKGNDKSLMRWDGRNINTLKVNNGGKIEYYLAFSNSSEGGDITIYKSGNASTDFKPIEVMNYRIADSHMPGDTTYGSYYISKVENGQPYFIFSQYEKQFFEEPAGGAMNDNIIPDNSFLIDVYTVAAGQDKATKVSTTKIPVEELDNTEELHYVFYSIGTLTGKNDVDMSINGTPNAPAFILTKEYCLASNTDERSITYEFIDNSGKTIKKIAENADGVTLLADLEGQEPQAMFVEKITDSSYIFHLKNLYTGEEVATINQQNNGRSLTAECNRVPYGKNDYKYAFGVIADPTDVDKDGNDLMCVAWFNSDGSFDRLDRFNIGKNVMATSLNWNSQILNPYLFDTDEEMEYAVMVKRNDGNYSYVEFIITDGKDDFYGIFNRDDAKGDPYSFQVIFGSDNKLQMTYYNPDRNNYNLQLYDLPFSVMSGGSGTETDPYQIATVADLQFIKENPDAYYVVTKDIDAAGYDFNPVGNFEGSIDGKSHVVKNLEIASSENTGLIGNAVNGASIKNLTFLDPTLNLAGSDAAGMIAGRASGISLENINVYNLQVAGTDNYEGPFGGLVGLASNNSSIQTSQVIGNLNMEKASNVGGIIGDARTGSKVIASSFLGSINANTEIGGIVGTAFSANDLISDCHVDATITGKNTIGGIAGLNNRAQITRNYVQGSLKATEAANEIFALGGVVGSLTPDWQSVGGTIVSNNVVALKSINAPENKFEEEFAGQKSTVHRIIGYSAANEAEEILDETTWEYTKGDPMVEEGTSNNYSLSSLAPVDSKVEAKATTAEGASIDSIERGFLDETLGFKFGETAQAPWHKNSSNDPWLYFESSFIIPESSLTVEETDLFNIEIRFLNRAEEITLAEVVKDLVTNFDERIIEMTGNATVSNGILSIEFKALKQGTTPVEITIGNRSADTNVTVVEKKIDDSGVEAIIDTQDTLKISYRGNEVSAEGASIEVYGSNGMKVAGGYNTVSVSELSKGIYVIVATDSNGKRATLKIAK